MRELETNQHPQLPHDLVATVTTTPAMMSHCESLLLFSLVLGQRPLHALELGVHLGGSSITIATALKSLKQGHLFSVDVTDSRLPETKRLLDGWCTHTKGRSPDILPTVAQLAEGEFDFVLIDADHEPESVYRDTLGVLPFVAPGAVILYHDAHYRGVQSALSQLLAELPCLSDGGVLNYEAHPHPDGTTFWGGFRLIRKTQ